MGEERLKKFATDGYLVLEDFVDETDVEAMKAECFKRVDEMDPSEHHTVFSTVKQDYRDNYFINSADRIGYFFEDGALDDKGNLMVEKHKSLNKIGHALHVLCPSFKKVTFSNKMKTLMSELGHNDPVVVQSMYIFKQPNIGGEVTPHQDGSYIHSEPLTAMGVWIALEDTTLENGCLWFVPGSHKGGLKGNYRMVRNPEEGPRCVYIGEKPDYGSDNWIPVPIKKGSMIVIDGLVLHKSLPNQSEKSRHIYTFHVYDKSRSKWSDNNWLQPTERGVFTAMNQVKV